MLNNDLFKDIPMVLSRVVGDDSDTQSVGPRFQVLPQNQPQNLRGSAMSLSGIPSQPSFEYGGSNITDNPDLQGSAFTRSQFLGDNNPLLSRVSFPGRPEQPLRQSQILIQRMVARNMPQRTARLVFDKDPGTVWNIRRSTTKDRIINYEIPDTNAAWGTIMTAERNIEPMLTNLGVTKNGALYYIEGVPVDSKRGRRMLRQEVGQPNTLGGFQRAAAARFASMWNKAVRTARSVRKTILMTPADADKRILTRQRNREPYQTAARKIRHFNNKYAGQTLAEKMNDKRARIQEFQRRQDVQQAEQENYLDAVIQNMPTQGIQFTRRANNPFI